MTIIGGKNIKELVWEVVWTKMEKTLTIKVDTVKVHPLYNKRYVRTKKYYVHIEDNSTISLWDMVKIRSSKPISKLKKWVYVDTVKKAKS